MTDEELAKKDFINALVVSMKIVLDKEDSIQSEIKRLENIYQDIPRGLLRLVALELIPIEFAISFCDFSNKEQEFTYDN